jgi:predicted nucleic acid-binding protein
VILFCDTSALVKLYVAEEGSVEVQAQASAARVVAVSRIAWAEMMAALARRARDQPADGPLIDQARARLRADWPALAVLEVTQTVVELAGEYADAFALRGYDSVQLASARTLQQAAKDGFCFACFDSRLQKAAVVLGMQTIDIRSP